MIGWWAPIGAGVSIAGAVALGILAVQERDFAYASGAAAWFVCFLFFARDGAKEARAEDAKRRAPVEGAPPSSGRPGVPAPVQRADPVVPMVPAPGVPRRPGPLPAEADPQIPGPVAHDPDCCRPRRRTR